jgi:nucleoside-diphosphate kinase
MVLEGPGAVVTVRTMMGTTNPLDSAPGTIRGDYALEIGENAVHGSDSPQSAQREIAIYFSEAELV